MTDKLGTLTAQLRTLALSRAPRPSRRDDRSWYRIKNADSERALVQLDGEIGWDVESSWFVKDLRAITASAIDLHINSVGGSVWDGYAIYNALVQHPATITSHIVGIAASAASFIAMAGDEIVAYRPSQMMIHDAGAYVDVFAVANAAVLRDLATELTAMADTLDQTSNEIAGLYARKAGGTAEDWRTAMLAETWYTPDSALAAGLVDRIAGDDDQAAGEQAAPAPAEPAEDALSRAFRAQARTQLVRARARQTLGRGAISGTSN